MLLRVCCSIFVYEFRSKNLDIWQPIFSGQVASPPERTLAGEIDTPRATLKTPESPIIAAIRDISRPVLGLKAVHEGEVVRIFLIIGPDQVDDPLHAAALLEGYASILSDNLNRATHFTAEAAQKESIRRLSWLRHHLNGPIGIAYNALDDILVGRRSFVAELSREPTVIPDAPHQLAEFPRADLGTGPRPAHRTARTMST